MEVTEWDRREKVMARAYRMRNTKLEGTELCYLLCSSSKLFMIPWLSCPPSTLSVNDPVL